MSIKLSESGSLPQGWVSSTLGEVCSDPQYGWTTSASKQGEVHLLRTTDITQGDIKWDSVPFCKECPKDVEKYLLKDGDIVISRAGSVGYSYLVRNPQKSIFASYLIRFKPLINKIYLSLFLKSPIYWKSISEKSVGIALANVNASKLKQIVLPIAPLPEQARIANKVGLLFSFLDAGVAQLRLVQGQLKRYRQAVLKAAFEGKLTQQWRETNTEKIEPVTKLIELIKEERKKKLRSKYRERPLVKIENLPKLPEGWLWTNCENLSYFVTSGSRDWKKYYSSKGPIFIRTQNINTNELNLDDVAHVKIPARAEGKRSLVKKNDILVIITGANVGKVALVDRDMDEAYVSQSVALIKLAMPKIGRFVQLSMITDGVGKTHLNKMVYGMGRPVLSLEDIRDVMVPIAPLAEQEQIVNKIKQKFSELTNLERVIQNNIQKSRFMRHSILKTAFEGKLIPQNLSDEPAEKLLERIKTERLNNKSKTKSQMELSKYVK